MKKLAPHGLVISWFYPPGNSSEGLVTYKLLKASGLTFDVFTRKTHDENVWDRNVNEAALTAKNVRVITASTNDRDEWIQEAVEFFAKNAEKYDFVMSRIMPPAAHIAGANIKDRFPDVLWVASFGDPLVDPLSYNVIKASDNPFPMQRFYRQNWTSPKKLFSKDEKRKWKELGAQWEKQRKKDMAEIMETELLNQRVFQNADLLVFNNPYQIKRAFADDYAKYQKKGILIPHTFDEELYPDTKKAKLDKKVHFVYTGHLDSRRNIRALLNGIKLLKDRDDKLERLVQFDLYGHVDDGDKKAIKEKGLEKIVRTYGDIDYQKSLAKVSEADWALLIDVNLNAKMEDYVYLPAKLIDYIGAKKRVFAITHKKGASADVISELQAGVVVTHTPEEIALYLAKILYQKYDPVNYSERGRQGYSARAVAKKLDQAIITMLKRKGDA